MGKRTGQIVLLVILGFLIGTGAAWFQVDRDAEGLANIEPASGIVTAGNAIGGPFRLVDHNGTDVTEANYKDSYKLVFFGFTSCPDVCPVELEKITKVMESLGKDADKVQPLFITVDPERDTPEVMKNYVELFHPKIIGLTGTVDQVKAAEDAYKVYAAKADFDANGYTINHSSFTFFLNPQGDLVELFSASDSAEEMTATVGKAI